MADNFYLPIGFKYNGQEFNELPIAETGGEAEKIFTKKPSSTKLHTWFAQVLASSIQSIGDEVIAHEYLKPSHDKNDIPDSIKAIPFVDAGSLLLQVQRECWEKVIKEQKIKCVHCGADLVADVDLGKIEIPKNPTGSPIEFFSIKLSKTYEITGMVEQLNMYEGYKYNHIKFRVATLGDAIKHQDISRDEILFWRKIAFDTMVCLYHQDTEDSEVTEVPSGYILKRGLQLFNKDFNSSTLKEIRGGLQKELPSAKFYYEEECPVCSHDTPFFATVQNFFSV